MKLSRLFNSARKRFAAGAIVALAAFLPVAVTAASTVKIEANTTVANATKAGAWGPATTAAYNEVVAVQVVYNNTEAPDSGKVAGNLRVKINIPTTAGSAQTITTKTAADNSNTVNGSATVNLGRADAYLQYIPGTATWKHATTANGGMTTTQKVSDDVVMNANGLVLENENPCQAGSIVVQARVLIPGVQVEKNVRLKGDHNWSKAVKANAGDTVQYMITYTNNGNVSENQVVIGDKLPAGVAYVAGTSYLANMSAPDGRAVADGVTTTGIIVGDYAPTANAFVMFDAKLPTEDQLACGDNKLVNVASAQPQGMPVYVDTADVTVTKVCNDKPKTPVYSCDLLTITKGENRTVTVSLAYTAKDGAAFKTVAFDWGDDSTPLVTDKTTATYQYAKDGNYNISAKSLFSVNGEDKYADQSCAKPVAFTTDTPPTTPPELPKTGAGNVIGIFAGAVVLGTIGYRLFLNRKLAR